MTVEGEVVGSIDAGLCVLLGVAHRDGPAEAHAMAAKLWHLRIFGDGDGDGRMDRPVADVGGQILLVSQFTVYGDLQKGRRPSWAAAAPPEVAEPLVELVVEGLDAMGAAVATGRFGADMAVDLVNDGPVTLVVDVDPPPIA